MKQAPIKIDKNLLAKAKIKADENNIPGGMTGIFAYLLNLAVNNEFTYTTEHFNWYANKNTSIHRDALKVTKFKDMLLQKHGVNARSLSFVVNFLFYNYINYN